MKFGALLFVLGLDRQNAINMQLLGGVWILQTFLSIVAGLFTRWFHRWALLAGWAVAMIYGTVTAYQRHRAQRDHPSRRRGTGRDPGLGTRHFGGPLSEFPFTDKMVYIGLTALVLNVLVSVALTFVFRALQAPAGTDDTGPDDYYSDAGAALPAAGEFIGEDASSDPDSVRPSDTRR